MMPATEEAAEAPLPAARDDTPLDHPSMRPAGRSEMSMRLEKLREAGRLPQDIRWVSAQDMPMDRSGQKPNTARRTGQAHEAAPAHPASTITQGSALSTLMRAATRQYGPAPALAPQRKMPVQNQLPVPQMTAPQPQMRGALRQVVRNVQQPSVSPSIR